MAAHLYQPMDLVEAEDEPFEYHSQSDTDKMSSIIWFVNFFLNKLEYIKEFSLMI